MAIKVVVYRRDARIRQRVVLSTIIFLKFTAFQQTLIHRSLG